MCPKSSVRDKLVEGVLSLSDKRDMEHSIIGLLLSHHQSRLQCAECQEGIGSPP
jgi:hypothetical protein